MGFDGSSAGAPNAPAPQVVAAVQLGGPESEQPDDVAGGDERIGDHRAVVESDGGDEPSTERGEQDRAVRALCRVQFGKPLKGHAVG